MDSAPSSEPGPASAPEPEPASAPASAPAPDEDRPRLGASRLFLKKFEHTLTIPNVIHFCTDSKGHTLRMLQEKFVGKNFGGGRIVRIVDVLGSSEVRVQRTNGSGGGYINVKVLAEVGVFAKWDILVGVRVLTNAQIVLGVYSPATPAPRRGEEATAVVTLEAKNEITRALAVGHLVPVRVIDVGHPPMKAQVAIYGVPLSCDRAAPVYRLRGSLDRSARAALEPMFSAILAELEARRELAAAKRADMWFFESLLLPVQVTPGDPSSDQAVPAWPDGPVWAGPLSPQPPPRGQVSLLDIVRRAIVLGESVPVAGLWSRPLGLYRSSPLAAHWTAEMGPPPEDWGAAVDGNVKAVFAELLKNVLDFLGAIRELPEVYGSPELVEQHRGLWMAMRRMQRPA